MDKLQQISSSKSYGGYQKVYSHQSKVLQCEMKFAAYLPPDVDMKPHPVIYWLSGLTCNEQNFITKSGVQKYAAEHNLVIICPDTSPRNVNVPGEDDSYDFGSGAGFYVDATEEPWKNNYQMYSYITKELPEVVNNAFPVDPDRQSIMGHSMGGHGALMSYLRNPGKYRCVSAFAPICNPTRCPWGRKALSGYLGGSIEGNHVSESWKQYDATCLVSNFDGPPVDILIDQGGADEFLKAGQLLPENFVKACQQAQVPVILNLREGYDHSYYYIASFVEEHIKHHLKYLNQ